MKQLFDWIINPIVSKIMSNLCLKEEKRQKHLEDIKNDVLQPMLNNLNSIYIPILEKEKGIVSVNYRPSEKFDIVPSYKSEEIKRLYQKLNEPLYNDVTENHFKSLIKNWESFHIELEKYAGLWSSQHKQIFDKINAKLDMSVARNFNTSGDYIQTDFIAIHIINCIYGVKLYNAIQIREAEKELLLEYRIVMKAPLDKLRECSNLINELKKDDSISNQLKQKHDDMTKRAHDLQKNIEELLKIYKLSGNCKFV